MRVLRGLLDLLADKFPDIRPELRNLRDELFYEEQEMRRHAGLPYEREIRCRHCGNVDSVPYDAKKQFIFPSCSGGCGEKMDQWVDEIPEVE